MWHLLLIKPDGQHELIDPTLGCHFVVGAFLASSTGVDLHVDFHLLTAVAVVHFQVFHFLFECLHVASDTVIEVFEHSLFFFFDVFLFSVFAFPRSGIFSGSFMTRETKRKAKQFSGQGLQIQSTVTHIKQTDLNCSCVSSSNSSLDLFRDDAMRCLVSFLCFCFAICLRFFWAAGDSVFLFFRFICTQNNMLKTKTHD